MLRVIRAVFLKDLAAEWRTKEILSAMFVFALLVAVIFNFAFDMRAENARTLAPGVLWVAFSFAGTLGLSRSFVIEKDRGCLDGLLMCPVDRGAIFLGKALANMAFMGVIEVIVVPVALVFFNLSFEVVPPLLPVIVLGTIGYSGVGTLFSAMAVNTRSREVMLPLLLFPVLVPVLVSAVKLTAGVVDHVAFGEMARWLQLLVGFDVIFLVASFLAFDYVVEE
jgi:heme exporter protein B